MSIEDKDVSGNPFEGPDTSGSESFFDQLDDQLGTREMEQPTPEPEQVTSPQVIPEAAGQQGNEQIATDNTNWKKRYDDSSQEARRQQAELKELQPFKSVINFLKEDSGAVEVLQGYLKNGGQVPTNVKEELSLDEDFSFDMDEAAQDPNSDSSKLLNKMVEKKAQTIVNDTLQQERQKAVSLQQDQIKQREREAFKQKMNFTEDQMVHMEEQAKTKRMTYDDLHLLVNRDQVNQNVQKSTQEDMMHQMQAVRNIPTSIGGTNNAGQGMSSEEQTFQTMFGNPFEDDENPF
jgi:hypothetical protein